MKTLRIGTVLIALVLVVSMFTATAMAECGDSFTISGEATFVLKNSGRLMGLKEAYESVDKYYSYEHYEGSSPVGVESDGRIVRYKGMSKAAIDGNVIGCGGTSLSVTISLYQDKLSLVKEIVARLNGVSVDELTLSANNIIYSTVYRQQLCEVNSMAAHVFFLSKDEKVAVGRVTFANGKWATLYAGQFTGTCEWYLGFAAGVGAGGSTGTNQQAASFKVTVEEHMETTVTYNYDRTITIEGEVTQEILDAINGIYDGEREW